MKNIAKFALDIHAKRFIEAPSLPPVKLNFPKWRHEAAWRRHLRSLLSGTALTSAALLSMEHGSFAAGCDSNPTLGGTIYCSPLTQTFPLPNPYVQSTAGAQFLTFSGINLSTTNSGPSVLLESTDGSGTSFSDDNATIIENLAAGGGPALQITNQSSGINPGGEISGRIGGKYYSQSGDGIRFENYAQLSAGSNQNISIIGTPDIGTQERPVFGKGIYAYSHNGDIGMGLYFNIFSNDDGVHAEAARAVGAINTFAGKIVSNYGNGFYGSGQQVLMRFNAIDNSDPNTGLILAGLNGIVADVSTVYSMIVVGQATSVSSGTAITDPNSLDGHGVVSTTQFASTNDISVSPLNTQGAFISAVGAAGDGIHATSDAGIIRAQSNGYISSANGRGIFVQQTGDSGLNDPDTPIVVRNGAVRNSGFAPLSQVVNQNAFIHSYGNGIDIIKSTGTEYSSLVVENQGVTTGSYTGGIFSDHGSAISIQNNSPDLTSRITNNGTLRGLGASVDNAVISISGIASTSILNDQNGDIRANNGIADSYAIAVRNPATDGYVAIGNYGIMYGRVKLSDQGSIFDNAEQWHTSGDNSFGAGHDILNNLSTGRIYTYGATTFDFGAGHNSVNNSGYFYATGGNTALNSAGGSLTVNNSGVIDLRSTTSQAKTLSMQGDYTSTNTATVAVGVYGKSLSDKVVVSGTAALSGSLTASPYGLALNFLNSRANVLSAEGGLSGRFTSQNIGGFTFLNGNVSYDANNVYVSYSLTPFSVAGRTINQRNVGNALTIGAYGPISGPGANILNTLFYGSYQSAQSVMDTVGGAGLAGVQTTAMEVGQMASSTVSDQIAFWRSGESNDMTGVTLHEGNTQDRARGFMAYAPTDVGVTTKNPITIKGPVAGLSSPPPPARTFRAWGSMFGGGANFLSDAGRGTPSATAGYYGGLLGVDYQLTPNALVGVSLGGSSSGFSVGSLSTTGKLTGFHAGLYGAYTMGASYLALNETFSAYSNQTNRSAGGYSFLPYESLTANFGSTEFRTRLEGGHSLLMGGLKATPFVAAEIAAYNANGFSERSSLLYQSSLALKNNGQAINSLPTFVGLRLSNAYTLENGWRLAPIGSLAYVHEFFPQRQFTNILMSMPGQDFNVAGPRSTYNLIQTKLGAQLFLNKAFALYSDFRGEFSSMSQSYGGTAGMKYYW